MARCTAFVVFMVCTPSSGRSSPNTKHTTDFKLFKDSPAQEAIASLESKWGSIKNESIVAVHMAFTTQNFGDNSVMIVSDYHPESQTLQDRHLTTRTSTRGYNPQVPEQLIWNYIVQMANALKAIHSMGLAARSMEATKWLLTDEGRIRFNACGLANVIDPTDSNLIDLQRSDLSKFGQLIFSIGTSNAAHNKARLTEHFSRAYTPRLKSCVEWLQHHPSPEGNSTINDFLSLIAPEIMTTLNANFRAHDTLQYWLNRELEHGRVSRLLMKLNAINERPEYRTDRSWSDQGPRAAISLFRDYVFHQVDAQGNPVLDMGHMLACLNKLDAGIEERISLVSRDEQTVLIVSYKEIKQLVERAYQELRARQSTA